MDWTTDGPNPYEVLGLENGPEANEDDIKKVYRKLAIAKHPDKNRGNPNAAAEFMEIDKAYRVLLDAAARGALDDWIKAKAAREQRDSQTSEKRRKLKQELEARERQAAGERNEEASAKMRLRAELERLRRRAEEEERRSRQQAAEAAAAAAASAAAAAAAARGEPASTSAPGSGPDEGTTSQMRRSLKVSWDPSARDYTSEQIRAALGVHGRVEDVVIKDSKKKRKATAFVVMETEAQAAAAAASVCGELDAPLLVTSLLKHLPGLAAAAAAAAPQPQAGPPGSLQQQHPVLQADTTAGGGGAAAAKAGPAKPLFPFMAAAPAQGGPVVSGSGRPAAPLFPSSAPDAAKQQQQQQQQQGPFGASPSSFPGSQQQHANGGGGAAPKTGGFGSFPGLGNFPGSAGGARAALGTAGFETAVLDKMRREAERKRALEVAQADEDAR